MENKKKSPVATIILTIICILWMYPIVLILVNSLKKKLRLQLQVYSVFLQLRHGMVLQTLWQVLHRWISSNPSDTVL